MTRRRLLTLPVQLIKSRWHVPVQALSTALAVLGYFLGHMHGGRQFRPNNAHAVFATPLTLILAAQVAMGIYLKLHLEKGLNGRIRRLVRPLHSFLGKAFPVLSWTQLVFGGITALGFCQGDHLGQCAAHFIMGGAFIAYGIILTIILVAGQVWVRRSGRSQEFYDSAVIAAWGCVNTFTEHRWGEEWRGNDWQHTTMGVVWWCAGLAGIWLSRDDEGRPKRNFVPGFVLLITGWGMSAHPQSLEASVEVHTMFGYTLMAAGISRIVEIAFVLRDSMGLSEDGRKISSFQYIPVFVSSLFLPLGISIGAIYSDPANAQCSSSTPRASSSWVRQRSRWSSSPVRLWTMSHTSSSSTRSPSSCSSSRTCSSTCTTGTAARRRVLSPTRGRKSS